MTTKQAPALQKAWEEYKKLYAEGKMCLSQANRLWEEAVKDVYGDMTYEWRNWNVKWQSYEFRLANGEVYGFTEEETHNEMCDMFLTL